MNNFNFLKMKKTSVLFLFGAVLLSLFATSCDKNGKKVEMKNDIDSISYAFGVANTDGLFEYLETRMNIDTANLEDFIKGVKEASGETTPKKKAYLVGLQIGDQIKEQMVPNLNHALFGSDSTKTINQDLFYKAFYDALLKKASMSKMEASEYAKKKMESIQERAMEQQFGANKKAGIAFLENNKKQAGVQTTASGLQYQVITEGKGEKPLPTDQVKVNYHGTLIYGTVFDSSVNRGTPAEFVLSQVIPGWTEGLQLMSVGSKYKFFVPYELAYGSREMGVIKPFSTLVFEVELLEIIKK